jgi:hypothetical protein
VDANSCPSDAGRFVGRGEDNASLFFVKSDDPKNEQLIEQEIHAHPGMSQYQVQTLTEALSQMTPEHLPAFNDALHVVIGLAVVVGFIVIFPGDVHRCAGANAGDRDFEVVRRFPVLHRQSCLAGNRVSGHGWHRSSGIGAPSR